MKKILLLGFFALLTTFDLQAQKARGYGFTATFRIPRMSKEVLLDSTLAWVRENLPTSEFYLRDIDETDGYITGRGTNCGDFGKVTYDLTFYAKRNVVDVVADNVEHSKEGRLPRKLRRQGAPKRNTKQYLTALSDRLEQYLRQAKAAHVMASKK
jgi:hypothetical protein